MGLTESMGLATGLKDQADTFSHEIKHAGVRSAITIEDIEQTK